jgi:hypothetical protein
MGTKPNCATGKKKGLRHRSGAMLAKNKWEK